MRFSSSSKWLTCGRGRIRSLSLKIPLWSRLRIGRTTSIKWVLKLEEGRPAIDMVIVIDVPAYAVLNNKLIRTSMEKRQFQKRVRRAYLHLAERVGGVAIFGDGPLEEVTI